MYKNPNKNLNYFQTYPNYSINIHLNRHMSISLQQLLKEKDRKIQQLERTVDKISQEYKRLIEKHLDCITDGRDKQREIDRLINLINTTPTIQEVETLRIQLQEWKNLALQLSTKVHNGHNYSGYN